MTDYSYENCSMWHTYAEERMTERKSMTMYDQDFFGITSINFCPLCVNGVIVLQ